MTTGFQGDYRSLWREELPPLNQFKRIQRDHNKDAGRLHYDHTWHSTEGMDPTKVCCLNPESQLIGTPVTPKLPQESQVSLWVNHREHWSLQGSCCKLPQAVCNLEALLFSLRPTLGGLTKQVSLWGYYWGLRTPMLRILQHKKKDWSQIPLDPQCFAMPTSSASSSVTSPALLLQ